MSLYDQNLARVQAAIALEPVDKVPFVAESQAFNVTATGVKMSEFTDPLNYEQQIETNLKAHKLMGYVDAVETTLVQPLRLPGLWLSKLLLAGKELPENELWQIHEAGIVTEEDYEEIIENGYMQWYKRILVERLGDPDGHNYNAAKYQKMANERFAQEGMPCLKSASFMGPFEIFSGGRTLATFLVDDLLEEPERTEAVFKVTQRENMEKYEALLRSPEKPLGVWVGGWRGTPDMLSEELFLKWSWRYIREITDLCLSYDVLPLFHFDSCWDKGLKFMKDLPKGRCLMALDGKTDIFLAKEIIGDRVCLLGDVPATLLAFGTPQDCYDYSMKLCREIGPVGFCLSSGCDIPYNAKLENVQMMAKAAEDHAKTM